MLRGIDVIGTESVSEMKEQSADYTDFTDFLIQTLLTALSKSVDHIVLQFGSVI
jgi:hypothetical protein